MNRMAFFVEGYTEVLFVERLLGEIAGEKKLLIEHREIRGGGRHRRSSALVRAAKPSSGEQYYVLIFDCGNDKLVKTRISEEHESLTRKGYQKIVGLRDVRPDFTHSEIPKLERELPRYIKTSLAPVEFILAVMEVEAWFLAEVTHFERIAASITVEAIELALGFNPSTDDMSQRLHPAKDLNDCYILGGKTYEKRNAKDTTDALDYSHVYLNLRTHIPYMDRLISAIDSFLS